MGHPSSFSCPAFAPMRQTCRTGRAGDRGRPVRARGLGPWWSDNTPGVATRRWSSPWCWAGFAVARCSACGCAMSKPRGGRCSSTGARGPHPHRPARVPSAGRHRPGLSLPPVAASHGGRSLGVGSYWPFEDWEKFLPEHTASVSLLDRLLHHSVITVAAGQWFRMRETREGRSAYAGHGLNIRSKGGDFPPGQERGPETGHGQMSRSPNSNQETHPCRLS
jgi:hypothetical protein